MKPLVLSAAAFIASFTAASGPLLAADAQELLKEKACLSCHTLDKKLVGPAYKEVAAKYKSRKDAEAYLVKKIKEGSTGVWVPSRCRRTGPSATTMQRLWRNTF